MKPVSLPRELAERSRKLEQEAYSYLVAGDFVRAEQTYRQQYEILKEEEQKLGQDEKYHKGGPLHNWGISLLLQNKILEGFQKIALAYIEDLLNSPNINDALSAPAFKTLTSYPLISNDFLKSLEEITKKRRENNRVPRDPEEIIAEYRREGFADLPASFTVAKRPPITIKQIIPAIEKQMDELGTKEKRVFIGGNYRNIAVLRHIKDIVERIDNFKAVLPIDLPSLSSESQDHLIHDTSIEYLNRCSCAIFEVSISNGHLMEIERARDISGLKVLLVFQKTKPDERPTVTRMLMTTEFEKEGYGNFTELTEKVAAFFRSLTARESMAF